MFIELTDHLRCTADHPESFLVLLPDAMDGRRVATGSLGCPRCGQVYRIDQGSLDLGGAGPSSGPTRLTPEAVAAFLGLQGPGGYVAIFGGLGESAGLAGSLPGIRLVLVNPLATVADSEQCSVVRSGRSPLKARSMRAVVVSADHGGDPAWVEAAIDAVLPGNPLIVEGPPSARPDLEVVASMPGLWVARKATGSRRP
ncbi:MAG: hypothetical protein FJ206_16825 [Gemmatimonadetes bacterium]|nr:hypothetical protein [Gemmatimonadota bacterium]